MKGMIYMAFSSHRKQFKGQLANISVSMLNELNYDIELLADRKGYIEEKYKRVKPFYDLFINGDESIEYYKVGLNKDDDLSAEINIFKTIERDGSYLLNSRDVPRDRNQEYTFLTEEEFKIIEKKEKNFSCLGVGVEIPDDDGVMIMIEPPKRNDYTNMEHKITKGDLEDPRAGQVLKDYDSFKNYLKNELEKIQNKEKSYLNLYQVRNLLKGINDDMIRSKISLFGIKNPAKRLGDESGAFYSEMIDYTDGKVIKAILSNIKLTGEIDPSSDLSHIAYDMEFAIKELHNHRMLDDLDLEIIECYNCGYTHRAIAEELNKGKTTINQRLNKIFRRISKFYEKN